jgi:hypothetical protein
MGNAVCEGFEPQHNQTRASLPLGCSVQVRVAGQLPWKHPAEWLPRRALFHYQCRAISAGLGPEDILMAASNDTGASTFWPRVAGHGHRWRGWRRWQPKRESKLEPCCAFVTARLRSRVLGGLVESDEWSGARQPGIDGDTKPFGTLGARKFVWWSYQDLVDA